MGTPVMTNKMQERKAEAAEFLVDARKLPPELQWKIQGMIEAIELMNTTAQKSNTNQVNS